VFGRFENKNKIEKNRNRLSAVSIRSVHLKHTRKKDKQKQKCDIPLQQSFHFINKFVYSSLWQA
jgi:hypothetical protein